MSLSLVFAAAIVCASARTTAPMKVEGEARTGGSRERETRAARLLRRETRRKLRLKLKAMEKWRRVR